MYIFNDAYILLDNVKMLKSGDLIDIETKDTGKISAYLRSINPLQVRLLSGEIMAIYLEDMPEFNQSKTYSIKDNFKLAQDDTILDVGSKIYFSKPIENIIKEPCIIKEIKYSYTISEIEVIFEFLAGYKYILVREVPYYIGLMPHSERSVIHPISRTNVIYNYDDIFISKR